MYRAVGNRCAIDFGQLHSLLPISEGELLEVLTEAGFRTIPVDLCALAEDRVGKSQHQVGVPLACAPELVDCAGLMKWLYAQYGIWLPRRTVQQLSAGKGIALSFAMPGDLIFSTGWRNWNIGNVVPGVGHVGMVVHGRMVVHADGKDRGVVKGSIEQFLAEGEFRGVQRYIPLHRPVLTLETPPEKEVETSDDIYYIVRSSLSRRVKSKGGD